MPDKICSHIHRALNSETGKLYRQHIVTHYDYLLAETSYQWICRDSKQQLGLSTDRRTILV